MAPVYAPKGRRQSLFTREIGLLLSSGAKTDPVALLRPIFGEHVTRWVESIRRVLLHQVGGRKDAVTFLPDAQHEATAQHVRRFCALMLMILDECRVGPNGVRAWGRALWRGRADYWELDADGELRRRYARAGHQGGLAARLGVCRKEVDRYLRVAMAAGLVNVWQKKTDVEKLPKQLRGKKHAFACFQWLQELPHQVHARLKGLASERQPQERPELEPSAPAPSADDSAAELFGSIAQRLRQAPRPAT